MTTLATPTTERLAFTVYGTPAPQGSKRHVGNGVMIESNKRVGPWREGVKLAALRALEDRDGWTGDYSHVFAHLIFALPRPQSHYRTGQFAHLLRDRAPAFHCTKPDLDKLIRSTFDALKTAGVYADDCRVAQVFAVKVYTGNGVGTLDRPGAHIELTGMRP